MLTGFLLATATFLLAVLLYSLARRSLFYWKIKGVVHRMPFPILGNYHSLLLLKKNSFEVYNELYKEFPNEPMVGLYEFTNPTLLIKDPELIEQVLIRDFGSFPDHGPFIFEPASTMYDGLFMMQGERWRALRNKLLSTFTTGRMREMHPGIVASCEQLMASDPSSLDRHEISSFVVDSFMRSIFGCKLAPDGKDEFRNMVRSMFEGPLHRYAQQQFLIHYPTLGNLFNAKYVPASTDHYFRSLVNTILEERASSGLQNNDFVDILLQLKNARKMNVFSRDNNKTDKVFEVTNDLLISQGFFFLFAGMDTTSLVMMYTVFELALNPQIQNKAREEVKRLLKKHGTFTYDAVREMKYMEQCIQESLRIHPSLVFLMRQAERPTKLGGVVIDKGTRIVIPNFSLQMDPKYFPDPEVFDPDRFHEDTPRNKFAHLPFSDGPRVCAGKKFSLLEIATLIGHLLNKYHLSLDQRTVLPMEYQKTTVFLTPKHPVVINLTKLEQLLKASERQ